MTSTARIALTENLEDVERLTEIHGNIGGDAQGRRWSLEVLNKAGVVLTCSFWEAYVEDLCLLAANHLADRLAAPAALATTVKQSTFEQVTGGNPTTVDIAWALAADNWRGQVKANATLRTGQLNTPKSDNVDRLFAQCVGVPSMSNGWTWVSMTSDRAKQKLDAFVSLRGNVAHRGKGTQQLLAIVGGGRQLGRATSRSSGIMSPGCRRVSIG